MLVFHDIKPQSTLRNLIPNNHALLFDLYPLKFLEIIQKYVLFDIHYICDRITFFV